MTTTTECRECAAGRQQAVNCDIAWRCAEHGVQRLDVGAILEALAQARACLARAEQVLSLLIEATCGGEVSMPLEALKDAKPLSWYASDGELSTMVVYEEGE
jgi:hypothetical protein